MASSRKSLGRFERAPEVQQFIDFVVASDTTACLEWPFTRCGRSGHARMWNSRIRRMDNAYRVLWEIKHGEPFPKGKIARHTCNNGHLGCVNLNHIITGTRRDNMRDRDAAGRTARGERFPQSKLTEALVVSSCIRLAAGESMTAVARDAGVSPSTLRDVWHNRRWKHVNAPRRAA